jgi:uncharacterized protein YkwD
MKSIKIFWGLIALLTLFIVSCQTKQTQTQTKQSDAKAKELEIKRKEVAKIMPSFPFAVYKEDIPANTDLSTQSLFAEINYARTNPSEYAKIVEKHLSDFKSGILPYAFNKAEYIPDCEEAINFLKKQPKCKELLFSRALGIAAFDHCKDMYDNNFTGHNSSNGSAYTKRISKYCEGFNSSAENIAYGNHNARYAVIGWIIDHRVTSRGHRKNIFANYTYVGIAWYPHREWRTSITTDFTSSIVSYVKDDNKIMEYVIVKDNSIEEIITP